MVASAAAGSDVDGFAFAGDMLDCDGHLYMEPDVMAGIVGDAGGSWIIEHLRGYVGTDADRAARERAWAETWSVKGISALGSYDAADRVAALDKMGIQRQPGRARGLPSLQRLRDRLDPARRRSGPGRLPDQHDRP